jgi:hypothetical protein
MSIHMPWTRQMWKSRVLTAILLGVAILMGGCPTVPKHMRVDTGLHPKGQDRDVRFRTTYYFRVFDYCADNPVGTANKKNRGIK